VPIVRTIPMIRRIHSEFTAHPGVQAAGRRVIHDSPEYIQP